MSGWGDLLTVPQVAERCGIGYRTLRTWIDRGLIVPAKPKKGGQGAGREERLSRENEKVIDRLVRLRRAGVGMDGLERFVADPQGFAVEVGSLAVALTRPEAAAILGAYKRRLDPELAWALLSGMEKLKQIAALAELGEVRADG